MFSAINNKGIRSYDVDEVESIVLGSSKSKFIVKSHSGVENNGN
jgi:hypothetical protein